jgi:hypothetical protein
MPTTQTTETTRSFEKRVCSVLFLGRWGLIVLVCVSPAIVAELKRIVMDSEILKYDIWSV